MFLWLNLSQWADLSQVLIFAVSLFGIGISIFFSIRTLAEIREDRLHGQRPLLAIDSGGTQLPIEYVNAGKRIPGFDPGAVEKAFALLPDNALSIRSMDSNGRMSEYGKITNFGSGSALNIYVSWIVEKICLKDRVIYAPNKELDTPHLSETFNTHSAKTRYLLPKESTLLSGIPTIIEKDIRKQIISAHGLLLIKCRDVYEKKHTSKQFFSIFTNYSAKTIIISFSDLKSECDINPRL